MDHLKGAADYSSPTPEPSKPMTLQTIILLDSVCILLALAQASRSDHLCIAIITVSIHATSFQQTVFIAKLA